MVKTYLIGILSQEKVSKTSFFFSPHFEQLPQDRSDRRLMHPRKNTEITKYMDAAWRQKEQQENLQ